MLRPGQLLALHRRGLLLSSFHPMSHLSGTSSITTRAINQFPAAGLSPAGHAALRAANRARGERGESIERTTYILFRASRQRAVCVDDLHFEFVYFSACSAISAVSLNFPG